MENFASLVPLVIIIPLAGAVINLFLGKRMGGERAVGFVATLAAGLAFGVTLIMLFAITRFDYVPTVVNFPLIPTWISIPAGGLEIPWQLRVDTLSLTMMMVVTGIGTLIHLYAIGYMHGDTRFPRFFVYLNLFLAFMLILVTGNNFLVMFVGWEGVGLCSFLLIGFWFDKARGEGWKNSNAARKAFIVNRVGDFGFLLAIFLTFYTFGTLDYYKPGELPAKAHAAETATTGEAADEGHEEAAPVEPAAEDEHAEPAAEAEGGHGAPAGPYLGPKGVFGQAEELLHEGGHTVTFGSVTLPFETVLTLIALCMLIGVTGKSAQIPLFVWLPDAMAGPTPVSALIHAATMVTAGIYLMVRSNVIFHASPTASAVVTIIGATTAVMAGFVAMGQWDIKRVLAYSTVSQLGFMVAAAGLGGYVAAMFHLITHAFFKACLFLGSGSVIHGVEHGHHIAHGDAHGGHDAHDTHDTTAAHSTHDTHAAHATHDPHDAHAAHAEHAPVEHEEHPPVFDPQDMRNMGGLSKRMRITYWTYLIGTLALAGIFPLSGFWSKDEILANAYNVSASGQGHGTYALILLLVAAGFTAFYMWRQMCLVFYGTPRTDAAAQAPESNSFMTIPLVVLAFLAVIGGLLNLPLGIPEIFPLERLTLWLEESVTYAAGGTINVGLAILATVVALGAIALAQMVYGRKPLTDQGEDVQQANPLLRPVFALANAKLYWDEIYGALIEQPFNRLSKFFANAVDWNFWHDYVHNNVIRDGFNGFAAFLANPVDRGIVDGLFNWFAGLTYWFSSRLRRTQTGYVRTYALTVLLGVIFVLIMIFLPLIREWLGSGR